jgi:hypothetical protein
VNDYRFSIPEFQFALNRTWQTIRQSEIGNTPHWALHHPHAPHERAHMSSDIAMPRLSDTMEEGTLIA